MKKQINIYLALLFSFFIFLSADCLFAQKIPVMVSILPQKYFVKQIGKDLVEVKAMVNPGSNPATYEPSPQKMVTLSASKIYFSIGVPFEKAWLKRFKSANPEMDIIATQKGIDKKPIFSHSHFIKQNPEHDFQKGHNHKNGHTVLDPHIWLDPDLVKIQAQNIQQGLSRIDPEHKQIYKKNLQSFIKRLDQLDRKLQEIFSAIPANRRRFMVFHPSWGYFAQAYELTQIAIEVEGKKPSPKELMQLTAYARKNDIRVIFIQPQFSQKSARTIARQINAQVATLDPLAPDWEENLLKAARTFQKYLN